MHSTRKIHNIATTMIDVCQWRSSIGLWCCHQISYNKRCRNDTSLAETGGAARRPEFLTEQSGCKNLLSALCLLLFFSFLLILSGDIESNPGPKTGMRLRQFLLLVKHAR